MSGQSTTLLHYALSKQNVPLFPRSANFTPSKNYRSVYQPYGPTAELGVLPGLVWRSYMFALPPHVTQGVATPTALTT